MNWHESAQVHLGQCIVIETMKSESLNLSLDSLLQVSQVITLSLPLRLWNTVEAKQKDNHYWLCLSLNSLIQGKDLSHRFIASLNRATISDKKGKKERDRER